MKRQYTIKMELKQIIALIIWNFLIMVVNINDLNGQNFKESTLLTHQKQLKKDGLQEELNMLTKADEIFKISAYCPCEICCLKTDGITASSKKARYGYAACNWLTFDTQVNIEGLGIFSVQDRGARSQFGSYKNKIKHIDIFFPTHKQAKQFGVQYRKVKIL